MRRLLVKLLPVIFCLLLCACSVTPDQPDVAASGTSQSDASPSVASPSVTVPSDTTPTNAAPTTPPAPVSTPPQNVFVFTRENMPRLNGSTSTVPLAEAVCSVLLGESRNQVADLVRFSRTTAAYNDLIYGYADLLIVGEDNEDILAAKAEENFEWEREPFATDAFIFVANEANPINSITIDEARRIYTGEITNWRQLGGENREIIAFQRNRDAGSQNLMEKLVMQGTPMKDAPVDFVVSTMGDLMRVVKNYDGSPGAIGYTVYYYAEEMNMARGLKILAIDGIEPNPETIRSGEYPLLNPKYVVIPADAPVDAPNRILFNWLLSDEGQRLVAHEGYVSVIEVSNP